MISKQKEIFNKLVGERLDEITELDEKFNADNLIYKYKGHTADLKFNKFDNSHSLIDKIKKGEISLADTKNNQIKFKSELGEIKKANKKKTNERSKKKKKTLCTTLKCFIKEGTMLLSFMMIILLWYLKQNIK